MVAPTQNIKDIMDSTRKSSLFSFVRTGLLFLKSLLRKVSTKNWLYSHAIFFVEHAESTA